MALVFIGHDGVVVARPVDIGCLILLEVFGVELLCYIYIYMLYTMCIYIYMCAVTAWKYK